MNKDNIKDCGKLTNYPVNLRQDYRQRIYGYKLSKRGDLLVRNGQTWEILIGKQHLADGDWLSDFATEPGMNFGQFVRAYLVACQRAGITHMDVRIYGFSDSYRLEDE